MRPHPSLSLDIYFFVRLSGPVLLLPYYYYDSHQLLDAVFFFFSVASFTLFSALSVVADGYCAVGASEIVDADWDGRIPISRKLA